MRIGFVSGTVIPEERGFVTLPLSMLLFHVILDTILGINLDIIRTLVTSCPEYGGVPMSEEPDR